MEVFADITILKTVTCLGFSNIENVTKVATLAAYGGFLTWSVNAILKAMTYTFFCIKFGDCQTFFYVCWEVFTTKESILVLTGWTLYYLRPL